MLRGGVTGLATDAADTTDARGVHDSAAPLLTHDLQDLLEAEEDATQVDRDDTIELVGTEVLGEVLLALDAGVVEEAVDAAEGRQGLVDVALGVVLAGDIRGDGEELGVGRDLADGIRRRLQALLGQVDEREVRTLR